MRIAIAGATGQVGTPLTALARSAGHEVVEITRSAGVDLTERTADLDAVLAGAEAVVDVTMTGVREVAAASDFFATVARNLGEAATEAGVKRTVLLSVIGVDKVAQSPRDPRGADDHFRAKHAHEQATLAHAPGVHVVRAAPFHDLARVLLAAYREGDVSRVPDMLVQPVDVPVVARTLLEVATGDLERPVVEVAGPRVERFAALAARFAARDGGGLSVDPVPVEGPVGAGALLPGPDAVIDGPSFDEWFGDRG
jgi:uncharacterized protein YbjT (DUF2867 family)